LSTGEHAAESVITLGVADSSPNFAASKLDVVVDLPRKNKGVAAREAYPLILTVILSEEEEEGEEEEVVGLNCPLIKVPVVVRMIYK
jgi:GTP cyclohydrolase FolE2